MHAHTRGAALHAKDNIVISTRRSWQKDGPSMNANARQRTTGPGLIAMIVYMVLTGEGTEQHS